MHYGEATVRYRLIRHSSVVYMPNMAQVSKQISCWPFWS